MSKIRPEVQAICESIKDRPLEWTQTIHTFMHKPTGLEIWTSNDDSHIKLYRSSKDVNVSKFNNWSKAEKNAVKQAMEAHQDAIVNHYFFVPTHTTKEGS